MIFAPITPMVLTWLLQALAPGGAIEEIRKLDPLVDIQWYIVGVLIAVIGYLEKARRDLRKEVDNLKDNTIRELQAKITLYESTKRV